MIIPKYEVSSVTPIQGKNYLPFVFDKIDNAKNRVWASIFIVDVRPNKDPFRSVRKLIEKLTYAQWRNIDVRVMVGVSKLMHIQLANQSSALYMKAKGLNVKFFESEFNDCTHSKYIIFDDDSLMVGSNNWTNNALSQNVESSLSVNSAGLNLNLAKEFESNWKTAKEVNWNEN